LLRREVHKRGDPVDPGRLPNWQRGGDSRRLECNRSAPRHLPGSLLPGHAATKPPACAQVDVGQLSAGTWQLLEEAMTTAPGADAENAADAPRQALQAPHPSDAATATPFRHLHDALQKATTGCCGGGVTRVCCRSRGACMPGCNSSSSLCPCSHTPAFSVPLPVHARFRLLYCRSCMRAGTVISDRAYRRSTTGECRFLAILPALVPLRCVNVRLSVELWCCAGGRRGSGFERPCATFRGSLAAGLDDIIHFVYMRQDGCVGV
jgi:hypothetical protein